jgi:thiol-disulfide isomerase/thioredoxin
MAESFFNGSENRQGFPHGGRIWNDWPPGTLMQIPRFISSRLSASHSLLIAGTLLLALALPFAKAAQKTALHLDGTPADPFHDASRKPVVLLFVRTDCPVSNRYAPLIQRISAQYAGKVGFWLVYPGKTASPEKVREHERDYNYKLPALRDPQHVLVTQAQVQVTPEAAVFDASHRLLYHGRIDNWYEDLGHSRPAATTHELEDAIQAALNGNTPPPNAPGVGCYIADAE